MSIIKHVTLQKIVAYDFRYDPRTLHTKETLEWFFRFLIRRQVIHIVKYAEEFVLLAKKEKALQGMTYRLTETGRFCAHINSER